MLMWVTWKGLNELSCIWPHREHPRDSLPVHNPWPYKVICGRQGVPQGFKLILPQAFEQTGHRKWKSSLLPAVFQWCSTKIWISHAISYSTPKTTQKQTYTLICQTFVSIFPKNKNIWNGPVWLYFSLFPVPYLVGQCVTFQVRAWPFESADILNIPHPLSATSIGLDLDMRFEVGRREVPLGWHS